MGSADGLVSLERSAEMGFAALVPDTPTFGTDPIVHDAVISFFYMTSYPLKAVRVGLASGILLFGMAITAATVEGQERDAIPEHADAELVFEEGIAAFERGDYEQAAERLRLVHDYGLNRKTTAALLMEGKALLRLGRYQEAIDVVETLLDRYPDTTYRDEAERLLDVAREERQRAGERVDTLHVGIALPMTSDYVALSQSMFNGIRLAVDEHNGLRRRYVSPPGLPPDDSFDVATTAEVYDDSLAEAEGSTTVATASDTVIVDSLQVVTEQTGRPDWVAKMHFRQTKGEADGARAAVDSLIHMDDVDVVIGPLFSRTARPAGKVAEENRTLLVAPMATDESVSEGKDYVFQTNPTFQYRGRVVARFASESLLTGAASMIYERGNSDSKRMAEGFREEAEQRGLDVPFTLRLDNPRGWSRLPEAIEDDSTVTDSMIAATEAIYLPIMGRNASGKIQDALTGVERLNTDVRLLGNSNWHDLSVKKEASQFTTTYANDFYVQRKRPEVQQFIRRHRLLTGTTPEDLTSSRETRLAYTGYDVARFLLTALAPSDTGLRPADLRDASTYEGLGTKIGFRGDNVNWAMFFHRYRNNRIELID